MSLEERQKQFEEMERAVLYARPGKKRAALERLRAERLEDLRAAARAYRAQAPQFHLVKS